MSASLARPNCSGRCIFRNSVDAAKARAEYRNGLLTVMVPAARAVKSVDALVDARFLQAHAS